MTKKMKKVVKKKEVEIKKRTPVSEEELRQMLNEQTQKQIQTCREEWNEASKRILDKYQCALEITMLVTSEGNIPRLTIIPRRRQ